VSAGFIRLNTVASTRNLAKHLMETTALPDDVELAVVCYHAKYSGLELTLIDRALNTITNRKRLARGESFSKEALSNYIEPLRRGTGKPNLLIIAVTTSIIETGRDHDYDWAILEPSSHRSLIQGPGRVRRHREALEWQPQNVSLIAYPEKALKDGAYEPGHPVRIYSYPGPLTSFADKRFKGVDVPYPDLLQKACDDLEVAACITADTEKDSCALGFMNEYLGGIRNSVAITPPAELENNLAILEQYVLFKSLTEPGSMARMQPESAVSLLAQQKEALLLSAWAYQEGFRDTDRQFLEDQVFLLQPRGEGGSYAVNATPRTRAGTAAAHVTREEVALVHPFRSILLGAAGGSLDMTALLAQEATSLASQGFSPSDLFSFSCFSPARIGTAVKALSYDPLLGFV